MTLTNHTRRAAVHEDKSTLATVDTIEWAFSESPAAEYAIKTHPLLSRSCATLAHAAEISVHGRDARVRSLIASAATCCVPTKMRRCDATQYAALRWYFFIHSSNTSVPDNTYFAGMRNFVKTQRTSKSLVATAALAALDLNMAATTCWH